MSELSTRALLAVDVSNLYHTLQNRFGKCKLDYKKLLYLARQNSYVLRAIAYGAKEGVEADDFISYLQSIGYETKWKEIRQFPNGRKKGNWDIDIAIDVIKILDSVDVVYLATADGDFAALVDYIQNRGKRVYVIGCGISLDLNKADGCIEIDERLLFQR